MINDQTVGIGIYVFNGENYIDRALKSIADQTIKIDKIFVSDNCSTDNTVKRIKIFALNHPELEISLNINNKNLGFLKNAEIVVNMCDTNYLLLLHVDDYLLKDSIEILLYEHFKNPSLALVAGQNHLVDHKGNELYSHKTINDILFNKGDIYEFLKLQNSYLPFSSVLHNTSILKEIKLNFKSKICDELYWPKVLTKYPILVLGAAVVVRIIHSNQTTYSYARNPFTIYLFFKEHLEILSYEKRLLERKMAKTLLQNNYADKIIGLAIFHLRHGAIYLFISSIYYILLIKPMVFFSNNSLYRKIAKKIKL